jgi:hypothetical protein
LHSLDGCRLEKYRIIVAFFVLLRIGACGTEIAPPGDTDVKAAFADMLDQYVRRVNTSRELIHMVRVIEPSTKIDLGPVEGACAEASAPDDQPLYAV